MAALLTLASRRLGFGRPLRSEGPEKALIAGLAPNGRMGEAMGGYQLAVGVGALPASLGFGLLWAWFGPEGAFLAGAAIAALAVALLFVLLPGMDESVRARGGS